MKLIKLVLMLAIGFVNFVFANDNYKTINLEEISKEQLINKVLSLHEGTTINDLEDFFEDSIENVDRTQLNSLIHAATNGIEGDPIVD